jgi:hypothetical protein
VICALVAAAVLATPSREVLMERWLHANRAHSAARLESSEPVNEPPFNLTQLAARELDTPGRYQLAEPVAAPPPQSWWEMALDWLQKRWDDLWRTLSARVHVSPSRVNAIGDGILVVVGIVLLAVILRLLFALQIARSAARLAAEPLTSPPDPQALFQTASDAANRGEYGSAALLLFAATVALLDGRAIAVDRSATVGDLRRRLRRADASLVAPFDTVAAPFVQRAYAERAVGAPQWERARDAFATLAQAVGS